MDALIECYVAREMSVREAAAAVNLPSMTAYRRLKAAGVLRTRKEAQALAVKLGKK